MSPLERSTKRRVCEFINDGSTNLVYTEDPWEDLAQTLLSAIDGKDEQIEELKNTIFEMRHPGATTRPVRKRRTV